MSKQKLNTAELKDKIRKGLDLSFERLVARKSKDGGELVFSQHGKIVHVKASDLLNKAHKQ